MTDKADTPKVVSGKANGDKFTNVADKLPPVTKSSAVASTSKVLSLKLENGKTVTGRYQRWDRDMNAPHLKAKKGEGLFYDLENSVLTNVVSWLSL